MVTGSTEDQWATRVTVTSALANWGGGADVCGGDWVRTERALALSDGDTGHLEELEIVWNAASGGGPAPTSQSETDTTTSITSGQTNGSDGVGHADGGGNLNKADIVSDGVGVVGTVNDTPADGKSNSTAGKLVRTTYESDGTRSEDQK